MRKILFCIRAYNDLDIQMPLIDLFGQDREFDVKVVFYGCDGFIAHHNCHDMIDYVRNKHGIEFESILQNEVSPLWLRVCYAMQVLIRPYRYLHWVQNLLPLSLGLKALDVGLSKLMKPALKKNSKWLHRAAEAWNADIIITDEVLLQPDRSPLIDHIIPKLHENGAEVFTVLTGHRIYKAVYPIGEQGEASDRRSVSKAFFVPSQHNCNVYKELFPKENIVVAGNLRMDADWVKTLASLAQPADLPRKKINVVMMLSKINYGIEVESLKEAIFELGRTEDVALAIKPHTRGMKFDFMSEEEIGQAFVVDQVSSSVLINWADVVLMTGSSIAFHAMVLDKSVGFMGFCQKLETLFDQGTACRNFQTVGALKAYLDEYAKAGRPDDSAVLSEHQSFLENEIYGAIGHCHSAQQYKNLIEKQTNQAE